MPPFLRWVGLVSIFAFALAACSPAAATPVVSPSEPPPTPPPTATRAPASTTRPAASATFTNISRPTATAAQTSEPTFTPSPRPTSTLMPSPSPPTPFTPVPAVFEAGKVDLALEAIVGGLQSPVFLTHAGDNSGRLFILERPGFIRIMANGALLPVPFLDIRDRVGSVGQEQGLLGLAFHPNFSANGRFFVYYTGLRGQTVLSRFQVSGDPNLADSASETVLLALDQPAQNHNGGMIAFGPDGFLYVGLGDGGAANDKFGNGQNLETLLGALLRLEVDVGNPYGVPGNNPFLEVSGARPELWAYGLRNPWRFSFDRLTGDLYIADVGQGQYEEVHVQPADSLVVENYGWPVMEGLHCFQESDCSSAGLELPVTEYDHSQGCSITGGYVYRGTAYPSLTGAYLYGDFCSGRIWALSMDAAGRWVSHQMLDTDLNISSFGEDEAGEVYVLDLNGGVYRLMDKKLPSAQ